MSSEVGLVPGLSGFVCYEGPLPKVLPISLEVFNLDGGRGNTNKSNKFTGEIPSEWGALTNLKQLTVVNCGLDGKQLSIRSAHFILFVR